MPTEPPRRPSLIDLPILGPEDFEPEEELEDEGDTAEEAPRTVLITGAAGNIGRKLTAAWADRYDLILVDRGSTDPTILAADLSKWDDEWVALFDEADAVVHLAGNPNEFAAWSELHEPNIDAMANTLLAAALSGVERFIFAGSNHAMGHYQTLLDPEIREDLPPRPDGPYGGTKLMGERLGLSFTHAFDMSFVGLRIGWVQHGENRPDTLPHDWARKMWLSNDDLIRLFTAAVEADLADRRFVVANGMSNNKGSRWPLDEARTALGYEPQDDAFSSD